MAKFRNQPIEHAVKFRLNHHCYLPGAEGFIGQVIEIRRELAERIKKSGGGEILKDAEGNIVTVQPEEADTEEGDKA